MMYNKVCKILLLFIFLPVYMFAQDITGLWRGQLYNDTTKQYLPYELAISEENGHYSGYSSTSFKVDSSYELGVKEISIKREGNNLTITDVKLVFNNYSVQAPKGVKQRSTLTLQVKDTVMILEGTWSTNRTKQFLPLTGTTHLERKADIRQSVLVKKLNELNLANNVSFIAPKKTEPTVDSSLIRKKQEELAQKQKEAEKKKQQELSKKQQEEEKRKQELIAKKQEEEKRRIEMQKQKEELAKKKEEEKKLQLETAKKAIEEKKQQELVKQQEEEKRKQQELALKKVEAEKEALRKAKPAADVNARATKITKNIDYVNDSLVLTLYDNGEIDGDTVTVLLNGQLFFSKVGLGVKGISKAIHINELASDSLVLTLYAENLGRIPPNTGLLVIYDGPKIYENFFSADLKNNASIILRRKKKDASN